jgi:hypothetical protein
MASHNTAADNAMKELVISLDVFPRSDNDLNWICGIVYKEYLAKKAYVKIMSSPSRMMQRSLKTAIDYVNDQTYNAVIDTINHIESGLKTAMPYPYKYSGQKIDIGVIEFTQKLAETCQQFYGNLPRELVELMSDVQNGVLNAGVDRLINLPGNLTKRVVDQVFLLKQDALKKALGALYAPFIEPFIQYEQWIKANGVDAALFRMRQIENCMRKPGICNRPARDFIDVPSRMLWSTFYENQMMIDRNGRTKYQLLLQGNDYKTRRQRSQINTILRRISTFYSEVV